MPRPFTATIVVLVATIAAGCGYLSSPAANTKSSTHETEGPQHGHKPGANGGIIATIGAEEFHVEAVLEKGGVLRLFTLGSDASTVVDVPQQSLTAYARPAGNAESIYFALEPQAQAGDPAGKTSQFVGKLPVTSVGTELTIAVPRIFINGARYRMGFVLSDGSGHAKDMPPKVADDAERKLYLTPGGIYTEADIQANGSKTASEKFQGVASDHDLHPKPGDKICPITLTKANPQFTWIIGGKAYEFCCPPCVDEFVQMAKIEPAAIKEPSDYVKRDPAKKN